MARLASEYPFGAGPSSVYLLGSHFENLRIAGRYVRFSMDEVLLWGPPAFHSMGQGGNTTSIVQNIDNVPGSIKGCRIDIPQFGSVYLGELFISPDARRLTMLRVELGCAIEGTLLACELDGHWGFSLPGHDPTRPKG